MEINNKNKQPCNIISNDISLKITSYCNVKYILTQLIEYNNYKSRKECIYGLFGSIIYRSISRTHRERFFHEYFKKKELKQNIEILDKLEDHKQYYNVLKEIYDEDNILKDFYYLIQNLYDDRKIFIKMKFSELLIMINDTEVYKKISKTKYNPSDIFYYFMDRLEQRLEGKNLKDLNEIDRYVLIKYHEKLEDSKEEGEI